MFPLFYRKDVKVSTCDCRQCRARNLRRFLAIIAASYTADELSAYCSEPDKALALISGKTESEGECAK
jgi:hypothetical protein